MKKLLIMMAIIGSASISFARPRMMDFDEQRVLADFLMTYIPGMGAGEIEMSDCTVEPAVKWPIKTAKCTYKYVRTDKKADIIADVLLEKYTGKVMSVSKVTLKTRND